MYTIVLILTDGEPRFVVAIGEEGDGLHSGGLTAFRLQRASRRQKPLIFSGKFAFAKDTDFPNGKARWKCNHVSGNCPANLYTDDGDVVLLLDRHTHT